MDARGVVAQAAVFGLVLARVAGVVATAPIFGNRQVPPMARAALALVLALLVLPVVRPAGPAPSPAAYALALAGEALFGLAVGLTSQLLFLAVQGTGELLDLELGFTAAQLLDPQFGGAAPLMSLLLYALAALLFLGVDGHHLLLRALLGSFAALPPGSAHLGAATAERWAEAVGWVWWTAIRLALPVLAVSVLVTAALAVAGRLLPQLNVLVTGLPVKLVVGLGALGAALSLWAGLVARLVPDSLAPALRVLVGGAP